MELPANEASPARFAKVPHLWALGVGAVISGDFFGWQSALIGGFHGVLVVLAVVTVLYVLLSFSIAEFSTTVPSGGGPYVFAMHGIGHRAAFFAGLAESLKVVTTCAVVVVGIGSYLNQLVHAEEAVSPIWWALFYVVFCALNVLGIELSFRIQLVFTMLSVAVLLLFYVGAATKVSYQEWVVDQNWTTHDGFTGIINGFSFSLWFYLGIEELPLAVEETIEPAKNMPRGLLLSIATLVIISFCTVTFNSMIAPGAAAISVSTSPLLDGYKTVFGDNTFTSTFTWLLLAGLIASFHSFVFCMGKLLYAIAKDGFFPAALAKLVPGRNTPYVAYIVGSGIGLIMAIALHFLIGDTRLGSVLINLALLGALVSYFFQLTAFILLRIREPERERPYKSPFGIPGAIICMLLCAFVFVTIVYTGASIGDFRASIIAAAVIFAIGAVYFFASGHNVVSKDIASSPLASSKAAMGDALLSPHSKVEAAA